MRMMRLLVLFLFNLLILHVNVFSVFAKAPTTPKNPVHLRPRW